MKRSLCMMLVSGLLLSFVGCGQEKAPNVTTAPTETKAPEVVKKAVLKYGMTKSEYKPMQWLENDKMTGFEPELIAMIGKEMGREVEWVFSPWAQIFDGLYKGDYDMAASSITISDERKKSMIFSDPVFDSSAVVIAKKDIKTLEQLAGKKLALQKDTTNFDNISKHVAGIIPVRFEKADEPTNALLAGTADAICTDLPVGLYLVKQNKDKELNCIKDEKVFATEQFGIAFKKGNEALQTEMNTALAKLKKNGEYQKLYDKYFSVK